MAHALALAPTYVGTLDLTQIFEILCTHLGCTPTEQHLLERMQEQYESERATVTSRETGQEVFRPERRSGSRHTFGKDMVASISKVIEEQCKLPDGSTVEPSHGDVLFYKHNDYFHRHRDTPTDSSGIGIGKTFYTLLVGLTDTLSGGETEVVDAEGRSHVYSQSAKRGSYLLFPSENLHSGLKINEGFKLALKLDYWFPNRTHHRSWARTGSGSTSSLSSNSSMSSNSIKSSRSVASYSGCAPDIYDYDYDRREDEDWCNGYHLDD